MVTIRPKTVITFRMHGARVHEARTDLSVRDHTITIDERKESGGTNQGIAPVEMLLASLVGCTNRITHKLAARHGVEILDMAIDLESQYDRRGSQLMEEVAIPFPEINLNIVVTTDADDERMERVQTDLRKFCPVAKVLRQAGTTINENWTIERP